jgi:hypothetical protein
MPNDVNYCVPHCVPQEGVRKRVKDPTLHKESVSTGGVHEYCLQEGLYGEARQLLNVDNKTARKLRKFKLKIGCRQAAKIMVTQMATRALRFISARAIRIIARKRHSNANTKKHNKNAKHSHISIALTLYKAHKCQRTYKDGFWEPLLFYNKQGSLFPLNNRAPRSGERNRPLGGPGRPGGVRVGTG